MTQVPTVPSVAEPQSALLSEVVATFRRWLHLPDPGVLYVVLGSVAANRMAGDPVWLQVIGPPGSGKTEVLGALSGLADVHAVATLTEPALLSGTPKRDRADGSKGGLLREIGEFGIVCCKDFGSVLSMHREARAGVLAALREIYDGAWTRHVGVDGGRSLHWAGKIGLVAGCTPAIDSHHAVMSALGERFCLYRVRTEDESAQARAALAHAGREATMRRELALAVARLFEHLELPARPQELSEAEISQLVEVARLAVRARSAVERDSYSRQVELVPPPEAPGRLALVLARLLAGLRAIGVADQDGWRIVTKVALDSIPALRRQVLEHLADQETPPTTSEVATGVGYPTNTAGRAMEDLAAHGVLVRISQGRGKADLWKVSDWTRERWGQGSPETSGGAGRGAVTSPEMSNGAREGGSPEMSDAERATSPSYIPLPAWDDKTGEVPVNGRETPRARGATP